MSLPLPANVAPYPGLVQVHQAAVAGDWARVASAHAALDDAALRTAACWVVAEVPGSAEMLTPVARAPGDSPEHLLARTMLACNLITTGWGIRTRARAKDVSRDQFRQFHEFLRRAEQLLIEVVAHQPDTVAAWCLRLLTARGLELGQSEARRRYDHAARYEPHHLAAQQQLLQQLCPKWSGTLDRMHAFARECAQSAPPGAVNPVLIVEAHLEHWVTLPARAAGGYLTHPPVQQDVSAAAANSVLNSAFRATHGWVDAHGTFALFHSIVGNHSAAAVHFRAVGEFDASRPWSSYVEDPESTYRKHRAAALAKG